MYLDPAQDARAALTTARSLGYPIPAAITDAEKVVQTIANAMIETVTAVPARASDPKKLAASMREAALEQLISGQVQNVGTQWRTQASAQVTAGILSAIPDWGNALAADYTATVEELRAASTAIGQLTADPANLAADMLQDWHTATQALRKVDMLVTVRQSWSGLLGETLDRRNEPQSLAVRLDPRLVFCAVVKLPNPRTPIDHVLAAFDDRFPVLEAAAKTDPATRWQTYLNAERAGWLALSMPRPGELRTRLDMLVDFANIGAQAHATDQGAGLAAMLTRADVTYRTLATASA